MEGEIFIFEAMGMTRAEISRKKKDRHTDSNKELFCILSILMSCYLMVFLV